MQQYKLKCDTINKLNQFKMGLGVDNANVAYVQAIYNSLNNNSKINSKQPNIQHVDLKTNNLKKEIFMKAIFDAVTILPERGTLGQVLVLLKKNFSNSTGMYKISDLKLACQYLIRDRLKSQGGEAFRKLIQDIYYIFEAIEKLIESDGNKLDSVKTSLGQNLARNTNGKTLKPLVVATTCGLFSAGGVAAVFFTSVFKTMKTVMLALVKSVSGYLGISSTFVVAGVITGALLAGALIGYGGYCLYRKIREDSAKARFNNKIYYNVAGTTSIQETYIFNSYVIYK